MLTSVQNVTLICRISLHSNFIFPQVVCRCFLMNLYSNFMCLLATYYARKSNSFNLGFRWYLTSFDDFIWHFRRSIMCKSPDWIWCFYTKGSSVPIFCLPVFKMLHWFGIYQPSQVCFPFLILSFRSKKWRLYKVPSLCLSFCPFVCLFGVFLQDYS